MIKSQIEISLLETRTIDMERRKQSVIAEIKRVTGPSMIRDQNGILAGYVFVDLASNDAGGHVEKAKQIVREKLTVPTAYSPVWSAAACCRLLQYMI